MTLSCCAAATAPSPRHFSSISATEPNPLLPWKQHAGCGTSTPTCACWVSKSTVTVWPRPSLSPIEHTEFRLGGFNLPLALSAAGRPETVRAIRAFNVLRQYAEDEVAGAYAELARHVLPGGLLVEGTSDPYGRIWVANVMRRTTAADTEAAAWQAEALVFSTNFRLGL